MKDVISSIGFSPQMQMYLFLVLRKKCVDEMVGGNAAVKTTRKCWLLDKKYYFLVSELTAMRVFILVLYIITLHNYCLEQ